MVFILNSSFSSWYLSRIKSLVVFVNAVLRNSNSNLIVVKGNINVKLLINSWQYCINNFKNLDSRFIIDFILTQSQVYFLNKCIWWVQILLGFLHPLQHLQFLMHQNRLVCWNSYLLIIPPNFFMPWFLLQYILHQHHQRNFPKNWISKTLICYV